MKLVECVPNFSEGRESLRKVSGEIKSLEDLCRAIADLLMPRMREADFMR